MVCIECRENDHSHCYDTKHPAQTYRGCGCQHDDARRPPHLCGVESQGEGAH